MNKIQLQEQIKTELKAGNKSNVQWLRNILTAVNNKELRSATPITLDERGIDKVIGELINQVVDTLSYITDATSEAYKAAALEKQYYESFKLPEEKKYTEEQTVAELQSIITKLGVSSIKDKGLVMKAAKENPLFDMLTVNKLIGSMLK